MAAARLGLSTEEGAFGVAEPVVDFLTGVVAAEEACGSEEEGQRKPEEWSISWKIMNQPDCGVPLQPQ